MIKKKKEITVWNWKHIPTNHRAVSGRTPPEYPRAWVHPFQVFLHITISVFFTVRVWSSTKTLFSNLASPRSDAFLPLVEFVCVCVFVSLVEIFTSWVCLFPQDQVVTAHSRSQDLAPAEDWLVVWLMPWEGCLRGRRQSKSALWEWLSNLWKLE